MYKTTETMMIKQVKCFHCWWWRYWQCWFHDNNNDKIDDGKDMADDNNYDIGIDDMNS